VTTADDGENPL
jgi:hypothetical protein